jgi:hypothetical protein
MLAAVGCARSNDTCTCVVDNSGERRTLACGETSCIAGLLVACVDEESTAVRGSCTGTSAPPPPPITLDAGVILPPDTSCDDLRIFCSTNCSTPATVAADCQTTASTGDPPTCASWQLTSRLLCRP